MSALQAHLDRLRVPLPALQRAAVAGVFDAIAKAPGLSPSARESAIAECLGCEHLVAVEAAVQAVLQADPAQLGTPPQDLLLAALAVAGARTAAALADGLLQLFWHQAQSGTGGAALASKAPPHATSPAAWRTHPLNKALLTNVVAAQPLFLGTTRLLTRVAGSRASDGAALSRLVSELCPFLSLVLLDPALQQQHPTLAPQLHGCLARVACCCDSTAAQQCLLQLLVARLPALRLQGNEQQAAASAALADVLDVVESCSEEPDPATLSALATSLVCLAHEATSEQATALLLQLLAALSHLAASCSPHLLAPCAADLGMLLLRQQSLGGAATQAVLALLAQVLQHASSGASATPGVPAGGGQQQVELAGMLLLPLLQHVAFGTSKDVKQWATHTLALLPMLRLSSSPVLGSSSSSSASSPAAAAPGSLHGAAAAVHAAQRLMQELWHRPIEARHWLASLQLTLGSPASAAGGSGGAGRSARDQQQLDSGVLLVLCGLLQHPAETVQRSVLKAVIAAVEATPLLGLTLLPLLVQQLQRQVELFLSGKQQRPSRLLLDLLRALPATGRHPATLPFVLRTLQQLLSSDAPEALQAVGLRLLSRLWQSSGGRAYQQLRAALIGYAAPGQQPGLSLRLVRAECLRDICTADPDKAAELVGLIQECLRDEAPAVQAIGLDCIALLCESDMLEFYAAWRVVHRQMPRLPDHPAAAAAWVRLLGSGGLDAAVQPDAAAAIIDALWLAAAYDDPQVRRQAYFSLAAFSFETQEEIGALRPLWHYSALLWGELQHAQKGQDSGAGPRRHVRQQKQLQLAAAECEALVQAALAHEHATRRRQAAVGYAPSSAGAERGSVAAGGSSSAVLAHRLQSVLPKQLLGGSAASAAELLQRLPQLPAAAVLFFYAPPPPTASSSKAAAAAASRQAASDYQAVFEEAVRQQPVAADAAEDAGAAAEALAAWAAFMRRWLAAVRVAAKQQAVDMQQAAADAAMQVWEVVHAMLPSSSSSSSMPTAAANAVWAAATLCSCTPQPLLPLVAAVHSRLAAIAAGAQAQHAVAVQRAAIAALGSMAEAVRITLGGAAAQQLLQQMRRQLSQPQSTAEDVAAAVTGLGLACKALASSSGDLPGATQQLVQEGLASLLHALCAAWPAASGTIAAASAADGLHLPATGAAAGAGLPAQEALPAAAAAVAAALPAASVSLSLPSVLCTLHQQLMQLLSQPAPPSNAALAAACCTLLQAVTVAGFAASALGSGDVSSSLRLLLSLMSRTVAGSDGRAAGSAAAAAGSLLAVALQQGFAPAAAEEGADAVLQLLLAVPEAAARLPHLAAAKHGAAAGVVALLSSSAVHPSSSPQCKAAVGMLEDLALRDGDPRARRVCALPLSSLCYAVKRIGGFAASAGSTAAAGRSKGLQQLAADGVLRPLLESLLEGHWALPGDSGVDPQKPLPAAAAAAILRCIAAAPRLPAMSFGLLCNRLLRTFHGTAGAAEVEAALVAFAAAHGSQQQCQLSPFVSELLSRRSLEAAALGTKLQLLRHLPHLLSAVPEGEAVPALAQHVGIPVTAAQGPMQSRRLLLQLLQSLALELVGSGSGSNAVKAAAAAAVEQLLLQPGMMPMPGRYPVHLAAALGEAGGGRSVGGSAGAGEQAPPAHLPALQQQCWAAALRCLHLLPAAQRDSLLQRSALSPVHAGFAACVLVAAGKLDGAALQHPRNLLLQGGSGGGSGGLPHQEQGMLALFVGRAVAQLPAGQQQQWLLDVLEACKACANPDGAFELAACIVSSSAAAAASEGASAQLATEHAIPAGWAVQALPFSLPLLLSAPTWQRSSASTGMLLQRLAAALQHLSSVAAAQRGTAGEAAATSWQHLLCRCLLAVRHSMPADCWALLASLL